MNYTPGPWIFPNYNQSNIIAPEQTNGNDDLYHVCTVSNNSKSLANAILIEAAPDMIDVIEKVDKYFIDLQNRCALTPSEEKLWSKITAVKYKALWYEPTKKR